MLPANDAHRLPDIALMRRSLQGNVVKLLDAQDHLIKQIEALGTVERQVRAMALLESSRFLNDQSDLFEIQRLGKIQAEMNISFRKMQETYVNLSLQISSLLKEHERLYEATFIQNITVGDLN